MNSGTLFVVATPIGNLGDLGERAREVLKRVDLIAAEDTRRTGQLLAVIGSSVRTISLHEHNETGRIREILDLLAAGRDVALVSDAGTPLLADPGYRLVRVATEEAFTVRPIPGPSAVTAALSVAGLATDRFLFAGFLPAKTGPRRERIDGVSTLATTLVFYEAPHRISATLADLAAVLGESRLAWVGRELTKQFESHRRGALGDLAALFAAGDEPARGEFVVIVEGAPAAAGQRSLDTDALLSALLDELPASKTARVAAKLTGEKRSALYDRALELSERT
ncbi:MAG: 16S rRNA (cytidine(1402)-2'-O)-methyltransferase [Pseudomonadota bacterium]|nr:16S rRNA (cytidine(1402)-2'-O)-methyltransferase [Pseudomonadota bacterium]